MLVSSPHSIDHVVIDSHTQMLAFAKQRCYFTPLATNRVKPVLGDNTGVDNERLNYTCS